MEINYSNKRYSMIIAGILLITLAFTFVAIVLGLMGCDVRSYNSVETYNERYMYGLEKNDTKENILGIDSVAVAESDEQWFDTEKGQIVIDEIESDLPDWQILPLCITNDTIKDFDIFVKVKGGYEPISGCSYITFYQNDDDKSQLIEKGKIIVVWTYKGRDPCYWDKWEGKFYVVGHDIELDSNQFPDGCTPICKPPCGGTTIPDKEVKAVYSTKWQGCIEICQRFKYILPQKMFIPRIPNPQ